MSERSELVKVGPYLILIVAVRFFATHCRKSNETIRKTMQTHDFLHFCCLTVVLPRSSVQSEITDTYLQ